jgi:hypothetical protein
MGLLLVIDLLLLPAFVIENDQFFRDCSIILGRFCGPLNVN